MNAFFAPPGFLFFAPLRETGFAFIQLSLPR
jgi:hypothetical protein